MDVFNNRICQGFLKPANGFIKSSQGIIRMSCKVKLDIKKMAGLIN